MQIQNSNGSEQSDFIIGPGYRGLFANGQAVFLSKKKYRKKKKEDRC